MPEPDEENQTGYVSPVLPKSKEVTFIASSTMDFDVDLDFDNSWPLDQMGFVSIPMSPFLISSSSNQLCSPLWALSDADNVDKVSGDVNCPLFLNCTNSETENPKDNDENRRVSSPRSVPMPLENPDGHCMIKERMTQALRYFTNSTEQHVLAQVWVPVKIGGRHVLTTSGQPFVLFGHSNGLCQFRTVSLMYMFSVDGENDGELGLPGRVFWQKLPEWTPNVQYYSSKEYSRLDHALRHNVRGTMALPVFEPSGQSCVGVIELIMTLQKINYASEVDKVCKALEAVNLKSPEILDHPCIRICNESRQNALAEILEILSVVCETHRLPLAQTWVPCRHRSVLAYGSGLKKSCSSIDGRCMGQVCMSTTDVAFYIVDCHLWGFREACIEHHLQKGQGVAGRAFFSLSPCFCKDVTQFCKTEYPLVHYARMFGLTSCFAICLRSTYTGDDDYILEIFLPPFITDNYEQQTLLGSILATMKQHFQSLKVASGIDLVDDGGFIEIIEATEDKKHNLKNESIKIPQCVRSPPRPHELPNGVELGQLDLAKQHLMLNFDSTDNGDDVVNAAETHNPVSLPENKNTKKPSERKRGKTEKSISLEVLQQYFAGSLKDAAKSLGVCPTTMKRICRQHGISRWPSRKIKKVNHSLTKLKRVIESVQCAGSTFGSTSLATSPPPVAANSMYWPSGLNGSNQQHSPSSKLDPHGEKIESPTCRTPGSNGHEVLGDQLSGGRMSTHKEHIHGQNSLSPDKAKGAHGSKTGSGSREEGARSPASHGSCQGSPANESAPVKDPVVSSIDESCFKVGSSPELVFQPTRELNLSAAFSIPDALVTTKPQEPFGGILVVDAGSSKDLRNLCPVAEDAIVDERLLPENSCSNLPCAELSRSHRLETLTQTMPHVHSRQEMQGVPIKATYREDIIRFRISLNSGILELEEEVAKRLNLDLGTFDTKYLDDDQEWVLITCDADLQECLDISRSSGSNIIRLSIQDVMANLGSSCESTGEL